MSIESEKRFGELGKTAAQPYINDALSVDVPLQTMLARIETWVQEAVFEEDKADRVVYQQAFIHELYLHSKGETHV